MVLLSPWFVLMHPGDVQGKGKKGKGKSTNKSWEDWPGTGKERCQRKKQTVIEVQTEWQSTIHSNQTGTCKTLTCARVRKGDSELDQTKKTH